MSEQKDGLAQHPRCQTDFCEASRKDGIICADDECDISSGHRTPAEGDKSWKLEAAAYEADTVRLEAENAQLRAQVEDAKDIMAGLFNFDMGSAERALKFLDDGLPTHEDVRGILSDTSTVGEGK